MSGWFPWKTLSLLLLVATAAIIRYVIMITIMITIIITMIIIRADVERHGSLESSNIGQFLRDVGQYDRALLVSKVCVKPF